MDTVTHWSDVFGRDVNARDVLAMAHSAGESLGAFLAREYAELATENPDSGWEEPPTARELAAWAAQIIGEAGGL